MVDAPDGQVPADDTGTLLLRITLRATSIDHASRPAGPLTTAGPLLVGLTELEGQIARSVDTPIGAGGFTLRPTVVTAGDPDEPGREATTVAVCVLARTTPAIGHAGLVHVITRLTENIAEEGHHTAGVEVLADIAPGSAPTRRTGE